MNRKGSILIILLWILTFLFLIGLEISYLGERNLQMVQFEKDRLLQNASSLAGLEYAKYLLSVDEPDSDSLEDGWARIQEREDFQFENGQMFELIRKDYLNLEAYEYGLEDLESRIPLGALTKERLARILELDEREERRLPEIDDLLKMEDLLMLQSFLKLPLDRLLGEDQNDDGILNENENDGEDVLPMDNRDSKMAWGLRDELSLFPSKLNVNTVSVAALDALLPDRREFVNQFLRQRDDLGGFRSIPSAFVSQANLKEGSLSLKSEFFLARVRSVNRDSQITRKYLLHRSEEGVVFLRELGY